MRILYILTIITVLITSCSKDDVPSIPKTVEFNDTKYYFNMPQISDDAENIIKYLNEQKAVINDETCNGIRTIEAQLNVAVDPTLDNLFEGVKYTIKYYNHKIEFINIQLRYNDIEPDEELEMFVNKFITEKYMMIFS